MNKFLKKVQESMLYMLPVLLVLAILDYRFHSYFWPEFSLLSYFSFDRFFDFVSIFTVFLGLFLLVSIWRKFKVNKFLLVLLGLIIAGGLISLFGNDLVEPILRAPGLYLVQVYILPVLVAMILLYVFRDKQIKSRFEYVLICSLASLALITILQYLFGILPGASEDFMGRAVWPYIDPFSEMRPESANWLSFIYAPMTLLGLMKVKSGEKWLLIPSLVLFGALFLSESYGGILTLLVLGFTYLFFNVSRKTKLRLSIGGLVLLGILVVSQYNTPKFQALIGNYHMPNSIERRAQIYQFSWESLSDNFISGIGLANYQSNFRENQDNYLNQLIPEVELPPHPHNLVFNFWSDLGFFGLIAILVLYVFSGLNLLKGNWSYLLMAYPLVHGLIDTPYILEEMNMMFWILFALSMAGAEKSLLAKWAKYC